MLEPLGQSQVLAYLERLSKDFDVHLISFEKPGGDASAWAEVRARMAKAGIDWHPLRYHRRFSALATAYDIARGTRLGLRLCKRHGLQLVHARSYVPSVMALRIKRRLGLAYLFDMRGFWPDERVDGGLWPRGGRMYKLAKRFERAFLTQADAVVSLTQAGADEIATFPYLRGAVPDINVIPTCADLARFRPMAERREGPFTLGYVGSAGTWYLLEESLALFEAVRALEPDARLLIVNKGEHDFIRSKLAATEVPAGAVELIAATHGEMPALINRMHAGMSLIKQAYSKLASAPTKLGEMLGCGVPVVGNDRIGDMAALIEGERVGVVVRAFDREALEKAAGELLRLARSSDIALRCVSAAERHFSVETGAQRYRALYLQLGVGQKALHA